MADRPALIVMLLASRGDWLWLNDPRSKAISGFAPAATHPCRTCGGVELVDDFGQVIRRRRGTGRVKDGFGRWQPCPACAGAGAVATDPMDASSGRLGSADTTSTARPRRRVPCDACVPLGGNPREGGSGVVAGQRCPRCDGTGWRDLHVFELRLDPATAGGVDPVTASIDRRDRAGSYHELDLALELLLHRSRTVWRATVAVHGPLLQLGVAFLETRLPDPLRVPRDVRENAAAHAERLARVRGRSVDRRALEQRNQQARRWVREGRPYPWIAAELGLSDRQLRRIVAGECAAA